MFQDSVEVSEPLSTMVQDLPDARARTIFQSIAGNGRDKPALLSQLKDTVTQSSALEQMVRPACRLLDTAVSDPSSKNRLLVVEVIKVLTARLKEISKIGTHAGRIFPSLLLLTFDGDRQVSDCARGVFTGFFPEAEKQNMFISKLRKELGDRLRDLVSELLKGDWDFGVAEAVENWGRMCGCLLAMICGLVYAANGAKEIFASVGEIPIVRWMKVTDGRFEPRMTAQARSYACIYMLPYIAVDGLYAPGRARPIGLSVGRNGARWAGAIASGSACLSAEERSAGSSHRRSSSSFA
jgi:hypothetical protein